MSYIPVHDGLPGGMECKGCKKVNTLNWMSQKVTPMDRSEALITMKLYCDECGEQHEREYVAKWRS